MKSNRIRRMASRLGAAGAIASLSVSLLGTPVLAAPSEYTLTNYDVSFTKLDEVPYQMPEQYPASEKTDQSARRRAPAQQKKRVLVFLDSPCVAEALGSMDWDVSDQNVIDLRTSIREEQDQLLEKIADQVFGGKVPEVLQRLDLIANAISIQATPSQIEQIAAIEGVADVVEENVIYPCQDEAETSTKTYTVGGTGEEITGIGSSQLSSENGQGARIAIVDTGLNADHKAFSADGLNESLRQKAEAQGKTLNAYLAELDLLDLGELKTAVNSGVTLHALSDSEGVTAEDLYVSAKVPFAFNYGDDDIRFGHDDSAGDHGTHVAGISAANRLIKNEDGTFESSDQMSGYASDAQILVMKVFGGKGAGADSDLFAAIEDAMALHCDAINMSLGTDSAGYADCAEAYRPVLERLEQSDMILSCAMSNSGNWSNKTAFEGKLKPGDISFSTGGAPGSYSSSLTVAATNAASYEESEGVSEKIRADITSFSSWGVPESLELKPEIAAPGQTVLSTNNNGGYDRRSGTSMSTPAVAGMTGVLSHWIDEQNLTETTGKSKRFLIQSLLMATAKPMTKEDGSYYPLMAQGAGEIRIDQAVQSELLFEMDPASTAEAEDGKIKAELMDDPDREGSYSIKFTVSSLASSARTYTIRPEFFTQKIDDKGNLCPDTRTLELTEDTARTIQFTVQAGQTGTIEVPIALSEQEKTRLTVDTPDGAYIEGYIFISPTELGEEHPIYSIPVFGYFGSWEDPRIFEDVSLYSSAKNPDKTAYILEREEDGRIHTNMARISGSESKESRYLAGNPYTVEETDADWTRSAFNSDQKIESLTLSQVRNPDIIQLSLLDTDLHPVKGHAFDSTYFPRWTKPYPTDDGYNVTWHATSYDYQLANKDFFNGLETDRQYNFTALASVEYSTSGSYSVLRERANSGTLTEGMRLMFPFTLDDEAPEMTEAIADPDGEGEDTEPFFELTFHDNQYPAFAAVYSAQGETVASGVPEYEGEGEAQPNKDASLKLAMPAGIAAGEYTVIVGDYARNETAYTMTVTEQFSVTCEMEHTNLAAYTDLKSGVQDFAMIFEADTNFVLDENVLITLEGQEQPLVLNQDYQVVDVDGDKAFVIKADRLKNGAKIHVHVKSRRASGQLSIQTEDEHLSCSPTAFAYPLDSELNITLRTDRGYMLPETVTLTAGTDSLDADRYSYDPVTGVLQIHTEGFEENSIQIHGEARLSTEPMNVEITSGSDAITWPENPQAHNNTKFETVFQTQEGYHLSSNISVSIDGTALSAEQYTYNPANGAFSIEAGVMIGSALRIEVFATRDATGDVTLEAVSGGTLTWTQMPENSKDFHCTLIAQEGWKLPQTIELVDKESGDTIPDGYSYNPETGEIVIFASRMKDKDLMIRAALIWNINSAQLDQAIQKADSLNLSEFSSQSQAALTDVLSRTRSVLDGAKNQTVNRQAEVDAAAREVNTVLLEMRKVPSLDGLKKLHEQMNN